MIDFVNFGVSFPFTAEQQVFGHDWQEFIGLLADAILKEQTPRKLRELRVKVYELLSHCIPANVIIKTLAKELVNRLPKGVDELLKLQVFHFAAEYEHRLQMGSKAIYHIEAFIAKIMSIYKRFNSSVVEILF